MSEERRRAPAAEGDAETPPEPSSGNNGSHPRAEKENGGGRGDGGGAKSLTVIIPAYNEEGNLEDTVEGVIKTLDGIISDLEIIILNDHSTDRTGEIADRLAASHPGIVRVVHNERNMGFGYNYTRGVELAEKEHVLMVPGDNEIREDSIADICRHTGQADIVISYTANREVRPLSRRLVSSAFTGIMNLITGYGLRYYNGLCVHRTALLRQTPMSTWGYAYMAAILSRLIKAGCSYVEVPMYLKRREHGATKAFRPSNFWRVGKTLAELFWEIRVKNETLSIEKEVPK